MSSNIHIIMIYYVYAYNIHLSPDGPNVPHISLGLVILWLGRWPIFAPSWMLFTHCNTRGFWIHCPWELPHQGCFASVCKNWSFSRTSRTEPCIWEVVKLTAKSTEEFMKTPIVWACDLRNVTGSIFRVLFNRDFRVNSWQFTSPRIVRVLEAIRFMHIWSIPRKQSNRRIQLKIQNDAVGAKKCKKYTTSTKWNWPSHIHTATGT